MKLVLQIHALPTGEEVREFLEGLETGMGEQDTACYTGVREFLEGLETFIKRILDLNESMVREFLEGLETFSSMPSRIVLVSCRCESS